MDVVAYIDVWLDPADEAGDVGVERGARALSSATRCWRRSCSSCSSMNVFNLPWSQRKPTAWPSQGLRFESFIRMRFGDSKEHLHGGVGTVLSLDELGSAIDLEHELSSCLRDRQRRFSTFHANKRRRQGIAASQGALEGLHERVSIFSCVQ